MQTVRSGRANLAGFLAAALWGASALQAQTTTMPSTLRYGSGLMDVPVASVLPHLAYTATLSGFFVKLDRSVELGPSGANSGFGGGVEGFYEDFALALGLLDRLEVGATIQSLNDASSGGDVWGLFGRLQLVRPANQGLGLALGTRYVTAPAFADGVRHQPNRLGLADDRFRQGYTGTDQEVGSELSFYGVATAHVRGFDGGVLPTHDLTFSAGYGSGMFQAGDDLQYYSAMDSEGWFLGSALHLGLGGHSVLTLMGEYNGFDVNVGAQVDLGGVRVGAHYLGLNYDEPAGGYDSEYLTPKFGVLASVALCPGTGSFFCGPELMERPSHAPLVLPSPPPDTVIVVREVPPPLPDGTPAAVCLATGQDIEVRVTAQGDTLVGPSRTSIGALRPGVAFAGRYAGGTGWFTSDEPVTWEERSFGKVGREARLGCGRIMHVGEHRGIPVFAARDAERPFETVYVPVRPGVWQAYAVAGSGSDVLLQQPVGRVQ